MGSAALVLLLSLAQGLQISVLRQFAAEEGMSLVLVIKSKAGATTDSEFGFDPEGGLQDMEMLTEREIAGLADVEGVAHAAPVRRIFTLVRLEGGTQEPERHARERDIEGVPPEEAVALAPYLVAGAFWTDDTQPRIVVTTRFLVRWKVERPADAVGRTLWVENPLLADPIALPLRVVGVVDTKRMGILRRGNLFVSVPTWEDLEEILDGGIWRMAPFDPEHPEYPAAFVRVTSQGQLGPVGARLRNRGYQTVSALDAIEGVKKVFTMIEGLFSILGGIGLVVALFGIANTMSMNVLERTREIGLMKAVGGTNSTVLWLFLWEAGLIGLMGGLVGLGLGWAGGGILGAVTRSVREMPEDARFFYIPWWLAAGAVLFAVAISMAAGLAPATRAARMRPAEALRYE